MNFLLDLLNELSKGIDKLNKEEVNEVDLTNDEEYNKLVNQINELKTDITANFVSNFFGIDNEVYDNILEFLSSAREQQLKEKKEKEQEQKSAQIQHLIEDKSKEVKRPSQNLSTEAGLQIHKLVQEYVDTMIKPYNPKVGGLTTSQINDAYAGLYEFAAWLYNK